MLPNAICYSEVSRQLEGPRFDFSILRLFLFQRPQLDDRGFCESARCSQKFICGLQFIVHRCVVLRDAEHSQCTLNALLKTMGLT